jgi:tetratricopeptide (TPR) repeat protein
MAELFDSSSRLEKWADVWKLFNAEEQLDACLCMVNDIAEGKEKAGMRRLVKRLASATGSRVTAVQQLAQSDSTKLAHILRTRALALLDHETWALLFASYYFCRKSLVMCAFLDQLGIAHDAHGMIEGPFDAPSNENIVSAVAHLTRIFTPLELGRYLAVLVLHSEEWICAASERDRILGEIHSNLIRTTDAATAQSEVVSEASAEFTVLDRVIIDQIVRSAMSVEGCLDAMQLEELVNTVSRLNEKWFRAYFFLGLMDVLIPGRATTFEHPGDNDQRRGWYLAGVIAGLVRGHDLDRLHKVLDQQAEVFARAVQLPGGPGATIASLAFRPIVESGRVGEGLQVLRGQLNHVGLQLGEEALEIATIFIRKSRYDLGQPIVDELRRHTLEDEDDEAIERYHLAVARRSGQCLQAAGNFEGADQEYRKLLESSEELNSPDLLADLGLVKGRFRSILDIKLPETRDERITVRDTLQRGEDHFARAIDRAGTQAPKAAYALATLAFLRWVLSTGNESEKEQRREQAALRATAAITAIHAFEFGATYREIGALGQCQFMLAVSRMNSFDEAEGQEAFVAWNSITTAAGTFPKNDVRMLLDAAELHGDAFSDAIAESVWEYRKNDAHEILAGGPWMMRSSRLRAALIATVKQEQTPRFERTKLWCSLIPVLIKANDFRSAEEGLSALEELADDGNSASAVLAYFSDPRNYDPVWRETEAAWARVYLLRRLGRDDECLEELRRLFYLVRDTQPWDAEQIVVAIDDWRLNPTVREELGARLPQRSITLASRDIGDRLIAGESVNIVFVGGNET